MRLAWLTDLHLDFATHDDREEFLADLADARIGAAVITGDTGESDTFEEHLLLLAERLARPIHFVLGNHDFYGDAVQPVRERARALSGRSRHLTYLPAAGVVRLSPDTVLVGADGWGDARLGDYEGSPVQLHDFRRIEELRSLDAPIRKARLQALGAESAEGLRRSLAQIPPDASRVVVATHVPPFRDACWQHGRISGEHFLPFFAWGAGGDVLLAHAEENPSRELIVLCGHTHGDGTAAIRPNLKVRTGGATYGAPAVAGVLEV